MYVYIYIYIYLERERDTRLEDDLISLALRTGRTHKPLAATRAKTCADEEDCDEEDCDEESCDEDCH